MLRRDRAPTPARLAGPDAGLFLARPFGYRSASAVAVSERYEGVARRCSIVARNRFEERHASRRADDGASRMARTFKAAPDNASQDAHRTHEDAFM
jgi:hypothetical protein